MQICPTLALWTFPFIICESILPGSQDNEKMLYKQESHVFPNCQQEFTNKTAKHKSTRR